MENKNTKNSTVWWQPAVLLFIKISVWIVAPVLIGTFVGRWLDEKYDTDPWLFVGMVGFAFVVSMIKIVFEAMKEYRRIEDEIEEEKQSKENAI